MSDFWSYSPYTNKWTQITASPTCPGRYEHGCAVSSLSGRFYNFGGGSTVYSEFWEWNNVANGWSKLDTGSTLPIWEGRLAFASSINSMYVFIGKAPSIPGKFLLIYIC